MAPSHLPADTARKVADQILVEAAQLTTGQLKARLRRLCIEADPDEANDRFEQAVEQRRVFSEMTVDGTINITGFDLSPDKAARASSHIDRLANTSKPLQSPERWTSYGQTCS